MGTASIRPVLEPLFPSLLARSAAPETMKKCKGVGFSHFGTTGSRDPPQNRRPVLLISAHPAKEQALCQLHQAKAEVARVGK